jgi:hypothetical protein
MNDKIGFAVFGGIGGLCLLIGIVLLTLAIRSIQEQQRYLAGHCTITSKQLLEQLPNGSTNKTPMYAPHFEFTVQTADGRHYTASGYDGSDTYTSGQESQQAIVDSYTVGQTYTCWYNPSNPTQAVLARNPNWFLFLMSGILLSIGTFFAIASVFILLGRVTWMQVPSSRGYCWHGEIRRM